MLSAAFGSPVIAATPAASGVSLTNKMALQAATTAATAQAEQDI